MEDFSKILIKTIFDRLTAIVEIDGKKHDIILWDTGGDECYDEIRCKLYPNPDVIVLVFSVVYPSSYEAVTERWIPEVRHYMPNIPIVLIGNQIDLRIDPDWLKQLARYKQKPITTEMGKKLAREINAAAYVETSCLNQRDVKDVFDTSIMISLDVPVEFHDKTPSLYILMMGDSNVGKIALTDAYVNESDYYSRHTKSKHRTARSSVDGEDYVMHIWSGEVELNIIYCAIILVFSVNDFQSYNNILTKWIPKAKQQCPSAPVILVGNKTDLREKDNETVTTDMGKQLAREINAVAYFECSCRDGRTAAIERIFETAVRASYFVKMEKFLKKSNKTLFKVYLIGDANVGKSSLQNRFQINKRLNIFNQHLNVVDKSFNERWHPGYSFAGFTEMDGEECGWIISHGFSNAKHADQYLLKKDRGIDVFMLMFSVVDFNSYLSIEKKWIPQLQKLKHYNAKIPIVLVGNKTDLRSDAKRHITPEMGEQLARKTNAAIYLECITSNEDQVERVFEQTAWASVRYAEERRKPKSQWFRKLFGRK